MPSASSTLRWTAINSTRKRSILEPLIQPSGPGFPFTDIYIPMSPPPRGGMPYPIRPLILPSPPTSPSCLTGIGTSCAAPIRAQPAQQRPDSPGVTPWHQSDPHPLETWQVAAEDIRKLDSMPMFRFSDLEGVQHSAIAQCYTIDRLDTPRLSPCSIAAMLNDSDSPATPALSTEQSMLTPLPTSEHHERHDNDQMDVVPLTSSPAAPSVAPASASLHHGEFRNFANDRVSTHPTLPLQHTQSPAYQTITTTLHNPRHLSLGSCAMDIRPISSPDPLPCPSHIPPSRQDAIQLPSTTSTFASCPRKDLLSRYLLNSSGTFVLDHNGHPMRTRASSIDSRASTGMSVSPRTTIPPYWSLSFAGSPRNTEVGKEERTSAQKSPEGARRGWWNPGDGVGRRGRSRTSKFMEGMDVSAPEGYFDSYGWEGHGHGRESGYEADFER